MIKQVYKYTGNMPSKNSFTWYFDSYKGCAFSTSDESRCWKKEPKIGDVITFWKSGRFNEVIERVFINEETVYERNDEIEKLREENEKLELDNLITETKKRLGTL